MAASLEKVLEYASHKTLKSLFIDSLGACDFELLKSLHKIIKEKSINMEVGYGFLGSTSPFAAVISSADPDMLRWYHDAGYSFEAGYYGGLNKPLNIDGFDLVSVPQIDGVMKAGEAFASAYFFDCTYGGERRCGDSFLYADRKPGQTTFSSPFSLALQYGYKDLARRLLSSLPKAGQLDLMAADVFAPDLYDDVARRVDRLQILFTHEKVEDSKFVCEYFKPDRVEVDHAVYNRVFDTLGTFGVEPTLFGDGSSAAGVGLEQLEQLMDRGVSAPFPALEHLLLEVERLGFRGGDISRILSSSLSSRFDKEGGRAAVALFDLLLDKGWIDADQCLDSWCRGWNSGGKPIDVLAKHGANLEALIDGETLLAHCLSSGKGEMAKDLILAGADLGVKTKSGRSLLQVANPEMRDFLKSEKFRREISDEMSPAVVVSTRKRGMSL